MTESGENKPSGQNTQIVLALIGLVGAVSTGVFTNWDKIFPATSAPPAAVESPAVVSASTIDGSATSSTGSAVVESAATPDNAASSEVLPNSAAEVPAVATNESIPQNLDLSGTWASPTLGMTEIKQDGSVVKGSYRTAELYGTFEGAVIENRLEYRWWQDTKRKSSYEKAEMRGTGSFAIQNGGRTLVGRWASETGMGGEWSLVKQD